MYSKPKGNSPRQKKDHRHKPAEWLDQLLESRYRELFGDDHLTEDIPIINSGNHQAINLLQATTLPINRQYERAMAEYQREREAEITRYNFQTDMDVPSTLQCKPAISQSMETIIIPDDPMEITISPQEEMEITGEREQPKTITPPEDTTIESKRQQKRKCWAKRKQIKRKEQILKNKQKQTFV